MGTLAAKIMKIMKGLYNRNTAPIYVKILLLNLEICANFHKTIRDDYDKIMSGEFIPTDVGVRKYFRRRYQQGQDSAVSNHALMSDDEFLATSPNQTSTSGTFTLSKQQLQNHSVAINHQDGSR